jgi:ribosomal protein S18 acetylase RimI-like enzyme
MHGKKRVVMKNEISYPEIENFMLIRRGTKEDSEECMRLFELDNETYWEISDFRSSAEHADAIFLVAEEDGRIVGYILGFVTPTRREEAMLIETRVHKKERGRGIGTNLVEAFCREAFARGAKTVGALVEPQHLKFYRDACSFKEVHKWIEVSRKKEN